MSLIEQLLFVVLGIAWLSAAATAVRSVSRIWLRHWVEQKLSGAITPEAVLDRPQRLLLSSSAGVGALALMGGSLIAASRPAAGDAMILLLAFVLGAVVFGQVIPRAIARRWPAQLIPVLLPVLRGVDLLITPFRALTRMVGIRLRPAAAPTAPVEVIEDVLREGQLEGLGAKGEIAIITGVVHFGDKIVANMMTPITDVFALDANLPSHELARAIAASGYSRVPIYRGSIDHVIGMVHAFDVMKTHGGEPLPVRPVEIAAPETAGNDLLFRMLRSGRHLAIVRGTDNVTRGVVTLEDVLEELVGDIRDEHDEPTPRPTAA